MSLPGYLEGITIDEPPAMDEYDYDDFGHLTIIGEISAPIGLGNASTYRRQRDLPGGVTKATVVTPFEILLSAVADQRDAVMAQLPTLFGIVNKEIRDLADAGCPHVQLDAPNIGFMVNEGKMEPDEAARLIAACFDGVTGTRRGVHFCNGNNSGRPISSVLRLAPWVPVLQRLEGVLDVAHLEASYFSEWLERDSLADAPASMDIAVGLVDEANYWPMPVTKSRERAQAWARILGEERLWLAPSCGFGRHPAHDRTLLEEKMTYLSEAAASF